MRKILVAILFAAVAAFAGHTLHINFTPISAGYSSLGRIETSVFETDVTDVWGFVPLRFDIRTNYDDDLYNQPPISLGSTITALPLFGIGALSLYKDNIIISIAALLASYLASGHFHYSFLDFKDIDFSFFESHVFEWWLYKKNGKWHMDEAGWAEELGLEVKFPYVSIDGGAQFEITNKQKDIGWFVKLNLFEFLQ